MKISFIYPLSYIIFIPYPSRCEKNGEQKYKKYFLYLLPVYYIIEYV